MSFLDFFRKAPRSPKSVDAVVAPSSTLAQDLTQATPLKQDRPDTTAPRTAHANRTVAAGRARTKHSAKRTLRRSERAAQRRTARESFQKRREEYLAHPRHATRLEHALDFDVRSAAIGFLTSWVSGVAVLFIAIVMLLNDPPFVYDTLRTVLNVGTGTPLWAVWVPAVLAALGTAAGLTIMLLTLAHLLGKAFAMLLFRGALLKRDQEFPEVRYSANVLPIWAVSFIALLGVGALFGAVAFLHQIAEERFAGGAAAAFGGSSAASTAITFFITALPIAVVILETIANHPVFAHARKTATWSLRFRVQERMDTRRDERLSKRQLHDLQRARRGVADLADMLEDVALRAQHEYVAGAMETGLVDATPVAKAQGLDLDSSEQAPATPSGQVHAVETARSDQKLPMPILDLSGQIKTGYLTTNVISNRVVLAIRAYRSVEEQGDLQPISTIWNTARKGAAPLRASDDSSSEADPEASPIHPVSNPDSANTAA